MKKLIAYFIVAALIFGLSACGSSSYAASPTSHRVSHRVCSGTNDSDKPSYTQADYDYVMALKLDGYEAMKVPDYNKKVLDWTNEESYHKTEDILRKVCYHLPDNDPNVDFVRTTLSSTWEECSNQHYSSCHRETPVYSGRILRETYGDIYGDQVLLTGAYGEFCIDYEVTGQADITIAQRDAALKNIETQMQTYLDQCSDSDLKNEENMEKKLLSQLKKLSNTKVEGITFGADCDISYYWNQPYEYEYSGNASAVSGTTFSGSAASEDFDDDSDTYSQKQYEHVINTLKFDHYETMTIAEFNRKIHNTLYGINDMEDMEDMEAIEKLSYDYEMVMMHLKDNDANADFLRKTIPTSLTEYEAKAREVYSGKTVDPQYSANTEVSKTEDVFGDSVETGVLYVDYNFSYRITAADKLTVKERDKFLNDVTAAVDKAQKQMLDDKLPTQAQVKAAIEKAGKTVSTDNIKFTGCTIEYFEAIPYN